MSGMLFVRTALGAVLVLTAVEAQENQGTLVGTVSDPSGAAVPNAKLKATHIATGVITDGQADLAGKYSMLSAPRDLSGRRNRAGLC